MPEERQSEDTVAAGTAAAPFLLGIAGHLLFIGERLP